MENLPYVLKLRRMNKNSKVPVPYSPDLHLASLSNPKLLKTNVNVLKTNIKVLKRGEKQRQAINRLRWRFYLTNDAIAAKPKIWKPEAFVSNLKKKKLENKVLKFKKIFRKMERSKNLGVSSSVFQSMSISNSKQQLLRKIRYLSVFKRHRLVKKLRANLSKKIASDINLINSHNGANLKMHQYISIMQDLKKKGIFEKEKLKKYKILSVRRDKLKVMRACLNISKQFRMRQKIIKKFVIKRTFPKMKYLILTKAKGIFVYNKLKLTSLILPDKPYQIAKKKLTLKSRVLNLQQICDLKTIINFSDLPYQFNLKDKQLLRYSTKFLGYNYLFHTFSYTLWLTMGLKRNIGVPFGLFFQTNYPRHEFLSSINSDSWKSYVYLIKDSFIKSTSNFNIWDNINFYINNVNQFFQSLSDNFNWLLRKKFKYHRSISLVNDLDVQISTYHTFLDYYDWKNRSKFFLIANNDALRETAFFITSYETSVILYPQRSLNTVIFWVISSNIIDHDIF